MNAKDDFVKTLIRMSYTPEAADDILQKFYNFATIEEKINYLKRNFDVDTVSPQNSYDLATYYALLQSIILTQDII